MTIVALVALIVVLLVLLVFGLAHVLGGSTPKAGTSSAAAGGVTAVERGQFKREVAQLDKTSQVAAWEFAALGSNPSGNELDKVAAPYQTALDRYESGIHRIGWPAGSQSALQADTEQLQALVAFLESSNAVTLGASATWLSQLHARTVLFEQADNALRASAGAPPASIFR